MGDAPGAGIAGNRENKIQNGENRDAPPGSAADLANQRKAAELLLEEFKKKAREKDFLKRMSWTEEQSRQFQKDYEEYLAKLKKKEAAASQEETLTGPRRPAGRWKIPARATFREATARTIRCNMEARLCRLRPSVRPTKS